MVYALVRGGIGNNTPNAYVLFYYAKRGHEALWLRCCAQQLAQALLYWSKENKKEGLMWRKRKDAAHHQHGSNRGRGHKLANERREQKATETVKTDSPTLPHTHSLTHSSTISLVHSAIRSLGHPSAVKEEPLDASGSIQNGSGRKHGHHTI